MKRNFEVFHRKWWQKVGGELRPGPGRRHRIGWAETEDEARDMCRVWNLNHDPGELSDKAEYWRV